MRSMFNTRKQSMFMFYILSPKLSFGASDKKEANRQGTFTTLIRWTKAFLPGLRFQLFIGLGTSLRTHHCIRVFLSYAELKGKL